MTGWSGLNDMSHNVYYVKLSLDHRFDDSLLLHAAPPRFLTRIRWCPRPDSDRHGGCPPTDFKSVASTNSATRAFGKVSVQFNELRDAQKGNGGWGRNRTGVHGFAGRCMTTLPPSHGTYGGNKKGKAYASLGKLERETRIELATSTLARLRSTS